MLELKLVRLHNIRAQLARQLGLADAVIAPAVQMLFAIDRTSVHGVGIAVRCVCEESWNARILETAFLPAFRGSFVVDPAVNTETTEESLILTSGLGSAELRRTELSRRNDFDFTAFAGNNP